MSNVKKIIEVALAFLGALLAAFKVVEQTDSLKGDDIFNLGDDSSSWH